MSADVKIIEYIAALEERDKEGKRLELNYVSWNGIEKLDIRKWDKEYTDQNRGIRFTKPQAKILRDALNSLDL